MQTVNATQDVSILHYRVANLFGTPGILRGTWFIIDRANTAHMIMSRNGGVKTERPEIRDAKQSAGSGLAHPAKSPPSREANILWKARRSFFDDCDILHHPSTNDTTRPVTSTMSDFQPVVCGTPWTRLLKEEELHGRKRSRNRASGNN